MCARWMVGHTRDADLTRAVDAVAKAQPIPVSAEVKIQVLEVIAGRLDGWRDVARRMQREGVDVSG